jgi:hypothetical protein
MYTRVAAYHLPTYMKRRKRQDGPENIYATNMVSDLRDTNEQIDRPLDRHLRQTCGQATSLCD